MKKSHFRPFSTTFDHIRPRLTTFVHLPKQDVVPLQVLKGRKKIPSGGKKIPSDEKKIPSDAMTGQKNN